MSELDSKHIKEAIMENKERLGKLLVLVLLVGAIWMVERCTDSEAVAQPEESTPVPTSADILGLLKEETDLVRWCYNPDVGDDKVIALTFDDGPSPECTAEILDILAENDAKATFFIVGSEIMTEEDAALVKRAYDEGHQLCTHTYTFGQSVSSFNFSSLAAQDQIDEINLGYQAISNVTGVEPSHCVRLPGGTMNDDAVLNVAPYIDAEIGWTIDTGDWLSPGSDVIFETIVNAEPGDRGLEPDERCPVLPPPQERFVPSDTNLLAFGVSPDGRSALCFGCVSPSVRVPDVFPRAVYTSNPAKDLPALETLYIDQPSAEIGAGAFAGHAGLRSVVLLGGSLARIQEKAFANCPQLNAFVVLRPNDRLVVAEDAFAGCAEDFAAVFVGQHRFAEDDSSLENRGKWTSIPCTNVFPRQVNVPLDFMRAAESFGPSVDLDLGRVELPILRFDGTRLERETSDGKVFSLDSSGRETKRRVAR